jgi:hypothetical protein
MRGVAWVCRVVHVGRPGIIGHAEVCLVSHIVHAQADDEVLWNLDQSLGVEAVSG